MNVFKRLVLANDVNETHDGTRELESLIIEIGKRVELLSSSHGLLYGAVKELSVVKRVDAKCASNLHIDTFAKQNKRFVEVWDVFLTFQMTYIHLPASMKRFLMIISLLVNSFSSICYLHTHTQGNIPSILNVSQWSQHQSKLSSLS